MGEVPEGPLTTQTCRNALATAPLIPFEFPRGSSVRNTPVCHLYPLEEPLRFGGRVSSQDCRPLVR